MEAPREIYLQLVDDDGVDLVEVGEQTFCEDQIYEKDVRYVRADWHELRISVLKDRLDDLEIEIYRLKGFRPMTQEEIDSHNAHINQEIK